MKKIYFGLCFMIILMIGFTFNANAENCNTMIEEWFGHQIETFSIGDDSQDKITTAIHRYFDVRKTSLYEESSIDYDFISDDVLEVENERRSNIVNMQNKMNINIINADNNVNINDVIQKDNCYYVTAYEWIFYDYDDLDGDNYVINVSGFGVEHELILDSNLIIISDLYDESDLTGICTIEKGTENIEHTLLTSLDNEISLMSTIYSGYNPDAVAAYADKYTYNYNTDYYNFNSVGGDCANFTSQSIYAGGMPQVVGTAYGMDGWYYKTSSNRSATWTGASQLRTWMANNRGNLINNPNASQIYKGSPVFYDWYNDGTWDHATICVGTNSEGTPIIDSHNSDRYHVKWNYGYDSTKYSTVQLTNGNYINTEPPSKSIISTAKTEYAVDEIVNFKFDTDGTKGCNVLWIYCPDGSTLYYTDLYDTYSLGFGMSGNFEALVQTWNDVGSKSSEKIKFHIGAPTYAYISLSKHEFAANETITFTLNTDSTPNCNSIWIYYPDGSSKSFTDIGNSFSVKIDTPGNYEALVQAWNSIGAKSSERINFHIGSPTYANIQLPKNEFYVNEPISFYLDTDATPNCNCVWIYCPDGTTLSYTDLDTSLDIKLDKPGNYEAVVQAWNSLGSKQSNRIKFIVTDPNPRTESTVTKSDAMLIIDTKVHNIVAPYDILIVGYKGNRLVTMKRVPHDEQNSPYTLEGDIDEIKVMVWDGLSNLKPLCDEEEIPSSKWIIE